MPILHAQSYSTYAQRILESGHIHASTILKLSQRLPLSTSDLERLIHENTPEHHDAEAAAAMSLRATRTQLILALMEYDLTHPPTEEHLHVVTKTISCFADVAILYGMQIIRHELAKVHGEALNSNGEPMPMWVMGMGKLSGYELNVSSDIDLIFVFEHEGETRAISNANRIRSLSHSEFFNKLGRRLIKLLDDVTEQGFVFRVDMRLRPHGSAGALCVSLATLEKYLVTQARTWERFAWLKSRLINPSNRSELLNQLISPFVFRRYLDYDAVDALREIHLQIRQKAAKHLGTDIKIGSGGIREIEFIVQLFQIIKGARNSTLRQTSTLSTLPALQQFHIIDADKIAQLTKHYIFLRHLEHRIQYLNDAQTQHLPTDEFSLHKLAQAMQRTDTNTLLSDLQQGCALVEQQFNQLFEPINDITLNQSSPQNDEQSHLSATFDSPNTIQEYLAQMAHGTHLTQLPERNQKRYQQLVHCALNTLIAQNTPPIPVEYAQRIFNFLESIAKRSSYLALLFEYPKALKHLIKLFTRSRWVADYLTAHPILLDELLTPAHLRLPPDWAEVEQKLKSDLTHATNDIERQMDILRETHHAQIFRLLAQELDGLWTLEQLADHLSELTDILLRQALYFCWQAYPKRHQDTPAFTIIAYGKLGGKEMSYASDLDLVFLFDDNADNAAEIYTRFAQRLNNWLTTSTGAGSLFETDYRLRPNGASGLLVSSISMFKQYQNQSAWFWEHQAITRARYCVGDMRIGDWFEQERREILKKPRNHKMVIKEILDMRAKIQSAHPNHSDLFDVKYDEGGMLDIEFCVQALVLLHSHKYLFLLENKGNIALLQYAADAKLIPTNLAHDCANAYRHYRSAQHAARLQNITSTRLPYSEMDAHIHAVQLLLNCVLKGDGSPT